MNLYWVDNAIYKLYDEFVDPETGGSLQTPKRSRRDMRSLA